MQIFGTLPFDVTVFCRYDIFDHNWILLSYTSIDKTCITGTWEMPQKKNKPASISSSVRKFDRTKAHDFVYQGRRIGKRHAYCKPKKPSQNKPITPSIGFAATLLCQFAWLQINTDINIEKWSTSLAIPDLLRKVRKDSIILPRNLLHRKRRRMKSKSKSGFLSLGWLDRLC